MGYLIYSERLAALSLDREEGLQLPTWSTKEDVS